QLKEELEVEKKSLAEQVTRLKEGSTRRIQFLKEQLQSSQAELIALLIDRYRQTEEILHHLKDEESHFPERWLEGQKLELNARAYTEMLEALTKMIETKNIGYHMQAILSNPIQKAVAPLLPDPPHLLRGFFLGCIGGMCLVLFGVIGTQAWVGPIASRENLTEQGYFVAPQQEGISHLGLKVSVGGPLVLLLAQHKVPLYPSLMEWFSKKGESLSLVDLTDERESALLANNQFRDHLKELSQAHDRVVILAHAAPESAVANILISYAHTVIYSIVEERMHDLVSLPKQTLFYVAERVQKPLSLRSVGPILERLLGRRFSFSFSPSVHLLDPLKRFLK
ncbi:MAG: hypothetical protein HY324_02825, partial [Chlamydiia bacterium]|nr:hypothetical protein [Chlamydiia bacterium]